VHYAFRFGKGPPVAGFHESPNLTAARRLFGEYGDHGVTPRMIAKDVGIDISTLYCHWGKAGSL
jgi:hypothetical protein